MNEAQRSRRVSLTKTQLQEGLGAELFSLCQGMAADGQISKDEIIAMRSWLNDNRGVELPGVQYLTDTLTRITADGRVTRDEQRELMEAIERVLPLEARREAKAARKAVEALRKADEKAARELLRREAREIRERRSPEDEFDFMVAGVQFEGRSKVIERHLEIGDRVRILPEPDNPRDECAVLVTLRDGRPIGYVPRSESEDVSGCIEDGGYYIALVKKILRGSQVPIPVVILEFYRQDQHSHIADLNADPCPGASGASQVGLHPRRRPWWKFW